METLEINKSEIADLLKVNGIIQNGISKMLLPAQNVSARNRNIEVSEELKQALECLAAPSAASYIASVSDYAGLENYYLFQGSSKTYVYAQSGEKGVLTDLKGDGNAADFAESLLMIEGNPAAPEFWTALSGPAYQTVLALTELKRRTDMDSMLHGNQSPNILLNPKQTLQAVEDEAFSERRDCRFLPAFMRIISDKKGQKPDLEAAFGELKEKGLAFAEMDAMTEQGAYLVGELSRTHTIVGVQVFSQDNDVVGVLTNVYANCYHSLWGIAPSVGGKPAVFYSLLREDLQKELKKIYQAFYGAD